MNIKQYLRQIRYADIHIDNLIKEREEWLTVAECCGALPIGDKIQSSPKPDKLENAVIRLLEVSEGLAEEIENYIKIKKRIIKEMEKLSNINHYNLLYKRYVLYQDFCIIAKDMGYNYQTILNMHGNALREFEKYKLSIKK